MLLMAASGALIAALNASRIAVVAGLLTFYVVSTTLLTVRLPGWGLPCLDVAATVMGLTGSQRRTGRGKQPCR